MRSADGGKKSDLRNARAEDSDSLCLRTSTFSHDHDQSSDSHVVVWNQGECHRQQQHSTSIPEVVSPLNLQPISSSICAAVPSVTAEDVLSGMDAAGVCVCVCMRVCACVEGSQGIFLLQLKRGKTGPTFSPLHLRL